jgi:abortive infection bacteriophage resistance protein
MSNPILFAEPELTNVKAPTTITGQLGKLRERGLLIEDEAAARDTLEAINYYRLVHYFAVYLDESGQYKEGTRFGDALRLYEFDRKLRAEVLVAVEEVEVAARAAVSNYHAVKYGALGYLNADSFDRRHNHKGFMNKVERIIKKNADLSFVRHYNKKHSGVFPLWVMTEMFSFGTLAVFYQDMHLSDKKEIADYYFGQDHRNVESWLECLAVLRNRCAHYNRIYGNALPCEPRSMENASLFDYLLTVRQLHRRREQWGQSFAVIMGRLFGEYSDTVRPQVLGFPENWREFFIKN